MITSAKCSECGAAIPADSPGGFCAQCLLGLGLAEVQSPKSEVQSQVPEIAGQWIEKPGDRIGRYRLLQEIGHGGCGVVYMAEQEEPVRRKVALKVIKLGMDTRQVVARFEAERQALALMDHSSIAKVLDAGATDTGRPFFVMELVGGIKITDYCDQNQLTTRQRLDLFIQVCQAVQHAHQKGVIHRDLKPSNVLVAIQDGVPVPKVIDFGIAKATQGRLTDQTLFTAFEQFIGTPAYMSPEQAQLGGLDIDTRSDIYSLGVLLYELLTGGTPFDTKALIAAGLDEMRRTIREVEPVKPSTRLTSELVAAPRHSAGDSTDEDGGAQPRRRYGQVQELIHTVRGDLDWIVMKCLEKDRARRYETANGLASDIQRHLNNEPVVARPPSNLYEFQKTVRRHKFGFAATTAIIIVLAVGVTLSTWQAIRATRAEREQSYLRQQAQTAQANEARERQQAQTEAAKSRQVAQFLKDLLRSVAPSVALGRDTTMLREVLDNASERVGKELKDQPEVELELRSTMGAAYYELSEFTKAAEMHRLALEAARNLYGEEHLAVARSLFDLALVQERRVIPEEPAILHHQALAIRRKLLGNQHELVAESLVSLARALTEPLINREPKLTEAESKLREALPILAARRGTNSVEVAHALGQLGLLLYYQRKLADAETLQSYVVSRLKDLRGYPHPDIAAALNSLSDTLYDEEKFPEAEAAQREALELFRKYKGYGHTDSVNALNNLVLILRMQGKLDDAERLLNALPPPVKGDQPFLLRCRASWRLRDGRFVEAAADLSKLQEVNPDDYWIWCVRVMILGENGKAEEYHNLRQAMLARFVSPKDWEVAGEMAIACLLLPPTGADLNATSRLAATAALRKENRSKGLVQVANALAEYRQARFASAAEWARQALTAPGWDVLGYSVLAMTCQQMNQPGESHAALTNALERARVNLPKPNTTWFTWKFYDWLRAHILIREAVAMEHTLLGNEHPYVIQSLSGMAALLYSQGKLVEAETMMREALAARRKMLGDAHPDVITSIEDLADILLAAHKFSAAESVARECLATSEELMPDHVRTYNVRSLLGGILLAQKKYAEAERWLLSGYEGMSRREDKSPVKDKPLTRETLRRLVRLYEVTNRTDQCANWKLKLSTFDITEARQNVTGAEVQEEP